MEFFILLIAALAIAAWVMQQKWRRYHREFIEPIENKIMSAEWERNQKLQARNQASYDAALFHRDFRSEMQLAKYEKNKAYEKINELRELKSELHDEMDEVRSSLGSWHDSSKSYFGSGGRKIKEESLLGAFGLEQTMSQKRAMESERGIISGAILDTRSTQGFQMVSTH